MKLATCLLIALASVCFSGSTIGQTGTPPSTAENNDSKPIEQITVIGKKPILTLFNQLEAAKIDLYSRYNEYNNLEKYNVEVQIRWKVEFWRMLRLTAYNSHTICRDSSLFSQ